MYMYTVTDVYANITCTPKSLSHYHLHLYSHHHHHPTTTSTLRQPRAPPPSLQQPPSTITITIITNPNFKIRASKRKYNLTQN
ncbi:hypothetical protein Hanom_Chr13g01226781 [Helianthus anomalus]